MSHSLVNFHFHDREGLLAMASALTVAPHNLLQAAAGADGGLDVPRLVRDIVHLWEHPRHRTVLVRLARDLAAGGPRADALVDYFHHSVLERLQEGLGIERGRLVATVIVGTLFARYVIRIPSIAAMEPHAVVRMMLTAMGGRSP